MLRHGHRNEGAGTLHDAWLSRHLGVREVEDDRQEPERLKRRDDAHVPVQLLQDPELAPVSGQQGGTFEARSPFEAAASRTREPVWLWATRELPSVLPLAARSSQRRTARGGARAEP